MSLLSHGRAKGHEVFVIAPAESALHRACADIDVRSETAEFTLALSSIRRLRRLMRELRPEVVHGMSIFPVAFVRWLGLVPSPPRVGFCAFVTVDPTSALPVMSVRWRRPMLFVRNLVSRVEAPRLDAIFAASRSVADRLGTVGIRGRIIEASGRLDPDELAADSLMHLDVPEGGPRIGYAGYLEPLKGIDDLVTAFAEVAGSHPAAVLLIAGDGPEKDRLQGLASSLGVAGRVFFVGFLEPVAPMLAALDLFVSPSRSEALGRSILEAMVLGVPTVCTDSGGPAEFIRDGENGLLVRPGDPIALAAAMLRLLRDPEFAARLARSGHATALDGRYLLSSTLDLVFAEYERIARRARGAA